MTSRSRFLAIAFSILAGTTLAGCGHDAGPTGASDAPPNDDNLHEALTKAFQRDKRDPTAIPGLVAQQHIRSCTPAKPEGYSCLVTKPDGTETVFLAKGPNGWDEIVNAGAAD